MRPNCEMKNKKQLPYDISIHRKKIDYIDKKMYDLLSKRMEIIKKVKKIKQENIKSGSTIRTARGIEVIRNACKALLHSYQKPAIVNIWRNLISSSEYIEQKFSVISQNKTLYWVAREFFGNFMQHKIEKDTKKIIKFLLEHESNFAVLPIPNKNNQYKWWTNLAESDLKIFAIAPACGRKIAFIVGKVLIEPTNEEEFSLIIINDLKRIQHKYTILDTKPCITKCTQLYLIQIKGFHNDLEGYFIGSYSII